MLFKEENNLKFENDEIVKLGGPKQLLFSELEPHLKAATRDRILPAIGQTTYDLLEDRYRSSGSGSGSSATVFNAAIELIQTAELNCAMSTFVKKGAFTIDGKGVNKISATDHTPASYPEREELAQDYLNSGLKALDHAVELLTINASIFADFKTNYSYEEFFIQSASEFQKYYGINSSTRLFNAMVPAMRKVQSLYLKRELTEDFYTELLEGINSEASDSASSPKTTKTLLNSLRLAIANLTIAELSGGLTLSIDANDLQLVEPVGKTIYNSLNSHAPQIAARKKSAKVDGQVFLNDAFLYLQQTASETVFKTFFNSDKYDEPSTDEDDALPISNHGGILRL